MLLLGMLWVDVREHLELVELVNAQDSAGVFAVAAGFAAVAGAPAGVANRSVREVNDFVAVVAGESNLDRAGHVEVVCGYVVNLTGVRTEEPGASHDLWSNQGRGD